MEQFTMRLSWLQAIQNLGDAERGRLLTALLVYAKTQEPKGLRGNERFVFETIAKEIDAERAGLVQNAHDSVQNALCISEREKIFKAQSSEEGAKNTKRLLLQGMFEEFWKAYPIHVNRKRCVLLWEKINPDEELFQKILAGVEAWKKSDRWKRGYINDPDTWLRNEKWEDEVPPGPVHIPSKWEMDYKKWHPECERSKSLSSIKAIPLDPSELG